MSSYPDKTPELPKLRRTTAITPLEQRYNKLRPVEGVDDGLVLPLDEAPYVPAAGMTPSFPAHLLVHSCRSRQPSQPNGKPRESAEIATSSSSSSSSTLTNGGSSNNSGSNLIGSVGGASVTRSTVLSGHSRPLQPHCLRRRLPPEKLSEIGALLKKIDMGEDDKENDESLSQETKILSRPSAFGLNSDVVTSHDEPLSTLIEVEQPEFLKPALRLFAPMSKVLTINGKDYMIIGDLGAGGSCKVYSALRDGQVVAIKDVTLPDDPMIKENYLREIQVLKKLVDCEQVVCLYDFEIRDADDKLFMVMEKGDSDLTTVLKQAAKDWITVRFFWRDMLHAVSRIHKLGIIHQDLKPSNFIIVRGRLKLIDFGISDEIGDATSIFRECAIGTFNYMSPEIIQQSSGSSIKTSRASDIWSLGCILYSLAFGAPPFAHIKNIQSKMLAIVDSKHHISYPTKADPDLVDVLKQCLRRPPKERSSAEELLQHSFLLGPPCVRSTYQ